MLRYGLIGAGGIGGIHMRWAARHPKIDVCAVADPDVGHGDALARLHGARSYADHHEMLALENLDVVSIATPHCDLAAVGMDSLTAGCHLLAEKPLARHIGEAARLRDLASERNLQIGVLYQYRNFATPRLIKSIIESGKIGEIRNITWNWHELRPDTYYSRAAWRRSWQGSGGGLIMNQLIHDLDLLRWFGGEVEAVQASLITQAHDLPMEDALSASLRFQNGALATISGSINHSHAANHRAIMGTKGLIVLPDARSLSGDPDDAVMLGLYSHDTAEAIGTYSGDHQQADIRWTKLRSHVPSLKRRLPEWIKRPLRAALGLIKPGRDTWRAGQRPTSGHGQSIWEFVDAISDDVPVPAGMSIESAFKTLELANALIAAGASKSEVSMPLDTAAYTTLFEQLVSGEVSLQRTGSDNVSA